MGTVLGFSILLLIAVWWLLTEYRLNRVRRDNKKLQELQKQAIDFAPIGIGFTAPGGKWVAVNGALCTFLGRSEEELLQIFWKELIHPDDLKKIDAVAKKLSIGEIRAFDKAKRYKRAGVSEADPNNPEHWIYAISRIVKYNGVFLNYIRPCEDPHDVEKDPILFSSAPRFESFLKGKLDA